MINNSMVILWHGQFWPRRVFIDGHVVTEDIRWTVYWYPKHTQLLAKGIFDISCILPCSEIRPKCIFAYQVLPLFEPDDWCLVTEQQDASLIPSRLGVPSIVFINKAVCQHEISYRQWLVPWDSFSDIVIKLRPVAILKTVLIYSRVCWVKIQFPLWVRLQLPKCVKRVINVPNEWHGKVTWNQLYIQKYDKASNIHFPKNLVGDLLENMHTI